MATQHLDLEEQEQLDQLKAFWAKWGNAITWLLSAALIAYASWTGWQYWQRDQAQKAAQLYGELEQAAQNSDVEKARRILQDMHSNGSGAALTQHAQLLVAKVLFDADQAQDAKAVLSAAQSATDDAGLAASIALRLAAVAMKEQQWDAALKYLDGDWPKSYGALVADRRGDILQAKGERAAAIEAYQTAYSSLNSGTLYRQMVGVKLNALGVSIEE